PLREDLEPHRRLVEPRPALLELPQSRPLRLADRLARRLDENVAVGGPVCHQRRAFFFRFTRGCCGAAFAFAGVLGFGGGGFAFAPRPPPSPSGFGRAKGEEKGAAVFGISRRVISPCP